MSCALERDIKVFCWKGVRNKFGGHFVPSEVFSTIQ